MSGKCFRGRHRQPQQGGRGGGGCLAIGCVGGGGGGGAVYLPLLAMLRKRVKLELAVCGLWFAVCSLRFAVCGSGQFVHASAAFVSCRTCQPCRTLPLSTHDHSAQRETAARLQTRIWRQILRRAEGRVFWTGGRQRACTCSTSARNATFGRPTKTKRREKISECFG